LMPPVKVSFPTEPSPDAEPAPPTPSVIVTPEDPQSYCRTCC
jgi:hypothetical protein